MEKILIFQYFTNPTRKLCQKFDVVHQWGQLNTTDEEILKLLDDFYDLLDEG